MKKTVTQQEVDRLAQIYLDAAKQFGEHNLVTQRAEVAYLVARHAHHSAALAKSQRRRAIPATIRFCRFYQVRYYVRGIMHVEGGYTAATAATRVGALSQRPDIREIIVADYCEA